MKIQILTVLHKPYWTPDDPAYLPIQVGAAGQKSLTPACARDDGGENISEKNKTFCELTALYWGWKNLDADILGLCHYRRYLGSPRRRFAPGRQEGKRRRVLSSHEIEELFTNYDVILPRKRHYWIETRESQYIHAHHAADLQCVEAILREKHPEDLPAWEHMLRRRSGHICNLFIMRRPQFRAYCEWLFDILFEAEKRLDLSGYSEKDRRVFGYLGERLLDVWLEKKRLKIVETPVICLENQHWGKKICAFLLRKFRFKKIKRGHA